jgi:hypothetical protein
MAFTRSRTESKSELQTQALRLATLRARREVSVSHTTECFKEI